MTVNGTSYALVGSGSEWFWTAISGLVLAATFVAIYRQLRLQASVMVRDQLDKINQEWRGEWMTRLRLKVFLRLRDGLPLDSKAALIWEPSNFWEFVGGLARSGDIRLSVIETTIGVDIAWWWSLMKPHCLAFRAEISAPDLYEHFEWLGERMLALDSGTIAHEVEIDHQQILTSIAAAEERLALYAEMRGAAGD